MDRISFLSQASQQDQLEALEPISKWGGNLSQAAKIFFQTAEMGSLSTTISVNDAATFFSEVMRLQDPSNLKAGLSSILSIVRANFYLYGALNGASCVQFLTDLLRFPDPQLCDKVACLLSGVMCRYPAKFTIKQVHECADYANGTEAGRMSVLANLLKNDAWRPELFNKHQMRILSASACLNSIPTIYKAMMCLWLASFGCKELDIPASVVVCINEMLKTCRAEKVVRIGLMCLDNMLKSKALCESMAENDTMNVVASLEYEKWRDAEVYEIITKVRNGIQTEVKMLTNFERFQKEVTSGKLKWGFIHSDKFWLENVLKCDANNFRVIDHLMVIVRTSRDPETIAVACHDLGEFARLHPVGKSILTTRGAKDKMLELMANPQRDVAREALLCVQKLMLQRSSLESVAVVG